MPPVQTKHHSAIKDIRNIGIIAHVDAVSAPFTACRMRLLMT